MNFLGSGHFRTNPLIPKCLQRLLHSTQSQRRAVDCFDPLSFVSSLWRWPTSPCSSACPHFSLLMGSFHSRASTELIRSLVLAVVFFSCHRVGMASLPWWRSGGASEWPSGSAPTPVASTPALWGHSWNQCHDHQSLLRFFWGHLSGRWWLHNHCRR